MVALLISHYAFCHSIYEVWSHAEQPLVLSPLAYPHCPYVSVPTYSGHPVHFTEQVNGDNLTVKAYIGLIGLRSSVSALGNEELNTLETYFDGCWLLSIMANSDHLTSSLNELDIDSLSIRTVRRIRHSAGIDFSCGHPRTSHTAPSQDWSWVMGLPSVAQNEPNARWVRHD